MTQKSRKSRLTEVTVIGNQKKMEIQTRRDALMRLIQQESFYDQESLKNSLKKTYPKISQSTISRDLKDCKIGRDLTGKYSLNHNIEMAEKRAKLQALFKDVKVIYPKVYSLAITTSSGYAKCIATVLQEVYSEEVIGTISGEDVFLALIKDESDFTKLTRLLEANIVK